MFIRLIRLIIACFAYWGITLAPAFADSVNEKNLSEENNKWGYIDRGGNWILRPSYQLAGQFNDGLAVVELGDKWGVIDKKGKIVIPAKFDAMGDYSEGLIPAKLEAGSNAKWGYIDKSGQWIIKPTFDYALPFFEEMAAVKKGLKWGFIGKTGKVAIAFRYKEVICGNTEERPGFSEGLAAVCVEESTQTKNGKGQPKWGYINKKGKFAIPPSFSRAGQFGEGVAPVSSGEKFGCINKNGEMVVEPKFSYVGHFSNGLAKVCVDSKIPEFGFIDHNGTITIRNRFNSAGSFSEGLAAVSNDQWAHRGFIDISGNWAIKPGAISWANEFSDGLSAVLYLRSLESLPLKACD